MSTVRIRVRDRVSNRGKILTLTVMLNFILALTITFRIILNLWSVGISGFSSILGGRIYQVNTIFNFPVQSAHGYLAVSVVRF